jgi:subtilisin family serine protease
LLAIVLLTPLSAHADLQSQARAVKALKRPLLSDQVLVKFKPGRGIAGAALVAQKHGIRSLKKLLRINVDVLPVPAGKTREQFIAELKKNPDVEYAEPNGVMRAFDSPNDPRFSDNTQYYLGASYINAPQAWDITTGSPTVVVAVLDSGVVLTHQDIDDNLWDNPAPAGDSGPHGSAMEILWNGDADCLDSDPDFGPEQCESNDPSADDVGSWHGTHVAGIIGAETNNGLNMAGIGRNVRVMAVKVLNADGFGTFDSIAAGITYAVDNGASIINMSLGGPAITQTLSDAVAYAIQNDVVVVAAAGNDGAPCAVNYPAAIESVISVGAIDSSYNLASFSCSGTGLDLVAPGVSIVSLTGPGTNATSAIDGTSFSSPMVAAVAALIRSILPDSTINEVTQHINFNTTNLGASGYDSTFGFGMLNAYGALFAASTGQRYVSNPADTGKAFSYPNPVRPLTGQVAIISLPASLGDDGVEITIYTLAGEEVKKLTGTTEWNGKNDDGNYVASGMYIFHAKTSRGDTTGKLTVIK